ncbi:MAG: hypothetical protein HUJ51_05685 [Eggerthellaceae bacterium]|nr:hypothetical protein [Eggerthellaceae bacterium]
MGGGPGSGPVGCKSLVADLLPHDVVVEEEDGIFCFWLTCTKYRLGEGILWNFAVIVKAYIYIKALRGGRVKGGFHICNHKCKLYDVAA